MQKKHHIQYTHFTDGIHINEKQRLVFIPLSNTHSLKIPLGKTNAPLIVMKLTVWKKRNQKQTYKYTHREACK